MAPICIWIHLMKKARAENMNISRPLPTALKNDHKYAFLLYFFACDYIILQFITFHIFLSFLQHLIMSNTILSMNLGNDFRIILICNAYSTNQEYFSRPMDTFNEKSQSGEYEHITPTAHCFKESPRVCLFTLFLHFFHQYLVISNTITSMNLGNDFRIILICNAYSTNQQYFSRPLNVLAEALSGNVKSNTGSPIGPVPFSMVVLHSFTVHSKMSLTGNFNKTGFSRNIRTSAKEIKSLNIKGFLSDFRSLTFANF
uniref:Mediator of RNA polymerase II transcription subunit 23 n=1 Tax=Glossina austeni TaxID=7395 RepID=A0A1A9V0S9_GLOAU